MLLSGCCQGFKHVFFCILIFPLILLSFFICRKIKCKQKTAYGDYFPFAIPLVFVQIPKLIALASLAVRVQWRDTDEHLEECTADLMAVGGVLHLDILSLPASASKTSSWTLRAVTPDTQVIHRHVSNSRTLCADTQNIQVMHRHITLERQTYDTSQTLPTTCVGALNLQACMRHISYTGNISLAVAQIHL